MSLLNVGVAAWAATATAAIANNLMPSLLLMPIGDGAAQRTGSRMRDRPPGQDRVQRVAQVELGGLDACLAEILHAIVDAPQIQHRALPRQHHGFRRNRSA